jgi:hypothetical protein
MGLRTLRQGVDGVREFSAMKRIQPALARKPRIPRIIPTRASVPPRTAPPLMAVLWREMNPITPAIGPRSIPRHKKEHTSETIPMISDAIARPSVRGDAYPAPGGR